MCCCGEPGSADRRLQPSRPPTRSSPLAAVMAHGLGWGDIEKKRQIDDWLGTVKAEGLNPAGS